MCVCAVAAFVLVSLGRGDKSPDTQKKGQKGPNKLALYDESSNKIQIIASYTSGREIRPVQFADSHTGC